MPAFPANRARARRAALRSVRLRPDPLGLWTEEDPWRAAADDPAERQWRTTSLLLIDARNEPPEHLPQEVWVESLRNIA